MRAPWSALFTGLALTLAVGAHADDVPLSAETREGPVVANVSLSPAAPRLGDSLVLTLEVRAKAGVTVDMPAFGDALGRFVIVDFTPRQETLADGGARLSQRYTLQARLPGRQRIPRLRIEYLDERGGVTARPRELLTDELGFEVASVLAAGEQPEALRPARPMLAELKGPWLRRNWPWLAAAAVLLGGAGAALAAWLRRAGERARATAYDRALARLDRLLRQGLPDAGHLDAWYVELSDIVRWYIEERFSLRAPELTTEEFLLETGRASGGGSDGLSAPHRETLSAFLAHCDRVKFARYSPAADESQQALGVARRFLEETRQLPGPDSAAAQDQRLAA